MNIFIKISSVFLLALTLFAAMPVFAAEIFLEPDKNPGQEDQFKVSIFLDTKEQLNAVEGTLRFPPDFLELKSVNDANSIINFWVEYPNVISNGDIRFSGITPGGYKGDRGLIFSVTFKVLQEGKGIFDIRDTRVLQNDGKGTEAKLQIIDLPFIISKKTVVLQVPVSEMKDESSPESFAPEIARDPAIFDGRWFLVFATQDKGSGIDRYEVKEFRFTFLSFLSPWTHTESPYELNDQKLKSRIVLKAIDNSGNERISTVAPRYPLVWYNYLSVIGILIVVLAFCVFVFKKIWRRK